MQTHRQGHETSSAPSGPTRHAQQFEILLHYISEVLIKDIVDLILSIIHILMDVFSKYQLNKNDNNKENKFSYLWHLPYKTLTHILTYSSLSILCPYITYYLYIYK